MIDWWTTSLAQADLGIAVLLFVCGSFYSFYGFWWWRVFGISTGIELGDRGHPYGSRFQFGKFDRQDGTIDFFLETHSLESLFVLCTCRNLRCTTGHLVV